MIIKTSNGVCEITKISNDAEFESKHKRDKDGKFAPSGVGSYKDETVKGRETSTGVKSVFERASKNEPQITKDITSAITGSKASSFGLEYRLKTLKSMTEKAPRERMEKEELSKQSDRYIASILWDNVRYSQASNSKDLKKQMYSTLYALEKKGYVVRDIKNTFNNPKNPYKGINVKLRSPKDNGRQRIEMQFNTENNFNIKEKEMHKFYESWRESKDEKVKEEMTKKMFEIASRFDIPDDVENISKENYKKYKISIDS